MISTRIATQYGHHESDRVSRPDRRGRIGTVDSTLEGEKGRKQGQIVTKNKIR
jgi:hypothetical protein